MKTLSAHARFYGLLRRLPQTSKEEMVWQYSNMLTDSLSEFYERDRAGYNRMIADMQRLVNRIDKKPEPKGTANEQAIKKLRSAILHRLQKHGVDTTNWNDVNRFMENPRIAGKRLYDMQEEEMRVIIRKLESILRKDKQKQAEIARMTKLN